MHCWLDLAGDYLGLLLLWWCVFVTSPWELRWKIFSAEGLFCTNEWWQTVHVTLLYIINQLPFSDCLNLEIQNTEALATPAWLDGQSQDSIWHCARRAVSVSRSRENITSRTVGFPLNGVQRPSQIWHVSSWSTQVKTDFCSSEKKLGGSILSKFPWQTY